MESLCDEELDEEELKELEEELEELEDSDECFFLCLSCFLEGFVVIFFDFLPKQNSFYAVCDYIYKKLYNY